MDEPGPTIYCVLRFVNARSELVTADSGFESQTTMIKHERVFVPARVVKRFGLLEQGLVVFLVTLQHLFDVGQGEIKFAQSRVSAAPCDQCLAIVGIIAEHLFFF